MIVSLGKVMGTAGTPRDILENLSHLRGGKTKCNSVFLQAAPGNSGKVYIGAQGLNKTTLKNVWAIVPAAVASTSIPAIRFDMSVVPNPYTVQEFFFDVDNTGEGICGNYQLA